MKKVELFLSGPVPSKKNRHKVYTNRKTGKPFVKSDDKYSSWETRAAWELRSKFKGKTINKCKKIRLTFFLWDNRAWDISNKEESVMDALVKAGVIKDDNWKVVPFKTGEVVEKDKTPYDPGVLIQIEY